MKKTILAIIMCIAVILGLAGCSNPVSEAKEDLENAKQELESTYEKYGMVEKETTENIIAKFNTEIMDNGINTPAYDDYMTTDNDTYWFGLTEDISFCLQPVDFSGNKKNDIVEMSAVYFDKDSYNEETAKGYVTGLIKANNYDLTNEEIDSLIKEAKEKSSKKETSNNGKGISVGYLEQDEYYIYQVIRLYRQ